MKDARDSTETAEASTGEDAILKAGPRAAPSEGIRSTASTTGPSPITDDSDGVGWGWRMPGNRDGRVRGWLPGAQALTLGELLAGMVAAAFVCFIVGVSLALAHDYWHHLPESAANNQELVSRLCGLAGGVCVAIRLRGSRLARRAHLRGER